MSNPEELYGYICSPCAKAKGAKWPDGHIASYHNGNCIVCEKHTEVCHTRDWNFPNIKLKYEEREV